MNGRNIWIFVFLIALALVIYLSFQIGIFLSPDITDYSSGCVVGYCLPKDIDGWTQLSPSAKVFYVSSSSGNDAWDGLAPVWDGKSGPKKTIGAGHDALCAGSSICSDWLLLKRGDSWDDDLGRGGGLSGWKKSGMSPDEPIVVGYYGESNKDRPLIKRGVSFNGGGGAPAKYENLVFMGLHFYNDRRDPSSPLFTGTLSESKSNFELTTYPARNIFIEDCYFEGSSIVIQAERIPNNIGITGITIRRNVIYGSYDVSGYGHSTGIYAEGINGLMIEENFFDHNGWREDFPAHHLHTDPGTKDYTIWRTIKDGRFSIVVDSVKYNIDSVNFASVTSMKDVASVIQNAINAQTGAGKVSVVWFGNGAFFFRRNNVATPGVYIEKIATYSGNKNGVNLEGKDWLNGPGGVAGEATIFNHNIYLQGVKADTPELSTDHVIRYNIITRASSHGLQARSGGVIIGNVFVDNPIGFFHSGHLTTSPNSIKGIVEDNIVLEGGDIKSVTQSNPRGWGFSIQKGKEIAVKNNIVANVKSNTGNTRGIDLLLFHEGVSLSDVFFEGNVIYNWNNLILKGDASKVQTFSGIILDDNLIQVPYQSPVLTFQDQFKLEKSYYNSNVYYSSAVDNSWFNIFSSNYDLSTWVKNFGEKGAEAKKIKFVDPKRDLATYNKFVGGALTQDAFLSEMRKQSKAKWNDLYSFRAVGSYLRGGYKPYIPSEIQPPNQGIVGDDSNKVNVTNYTLRTRASEPPVDLIK